MLFIDCAENFFPRCVLNPNFSQSCTTFAIDLTSKYFLKICLTIKADSSSTTMSGFPLLEWFHLYPIGAIPQPFSPFLTFDLLPLANFKLVSFCRIDPAAPSCY